MEKKLQNALVEILNATVSAKDFLVAEIPEVAHQLLVWKTVESAIFCVTALVFLALIVPVYRLSKGAELRAWPNNSVFLAWLPVFLMSFISWILFDFDWLQIQLAPKLYLAEYAMQLMGQ